MVFGNGGRRSGAGVAFSRDPSTGADTPVIDVLFESQGEDVVSGTYTPETEAAIVHALPAVAAELRAALQQLEAAFADVQDVEFTIENGKLWILQTRAAKRSPQAALRFAVDLVRSQRITPAEALRRLDGVDFRSFAHKRLADIGEAAGSGVGASPGVAVGRAAFDVKSAERLATGGDPIILVRPDTSTADVGGFAIAAGIVTAIGGRTAHAALVARQMAKPCIVGCGALAIDMSIHVARIGRSVINEGDWLSIDGGAGTIHLGQGNVLTDRPEAELAEVERWRIDSLVASGH
jgi:pyruvate,orthophosphate dikinase